jgi:hypothetical protein
VESTKVLLLSAEASKDQAVLTNILRQYPDLATRFARASLVRLVLSDPEKRREQGRILIQDAVRFARAGNIIQAREQIHFYSEWLNRRKRALDADEGNWPVEIADIAAQIETALLLAGGRKAYSHLCTWNPAHVRISVALELIPMLLRCGSGELVERVLSEKIVPAAWEVLLIVPLALSGVQIEPERLARALRHLRRKLIPALDGIGYAFENEHWGRDLLECIVTACEIAYANGLENSTIERGLSLVCDFSKVFQKGSSRFTASALDILLRAWLIHQSLIGGKSSADEFLEFVDPKPKEEAERTKPKRKKGVNKQPQASRRERLEDTQRRFVGAVFPVYESRIGILQHAASEGSVGPEQIQKLKVFGSDEYPDLTSAIQRPTPLEG